MSRTYYAGLPGIGGPSTGTPTRVMGGQTFLVNKGLVDHGSRCEHASVGLLTTISGTEPESGEQYSCAFKT